MFRIIRDYFLKKRNRTGKKYEWRIRKMLGILGIIVCGALAIAAVIAFFGSIFLALTEEGEMFIVAFFAMIIAIPTAFGCISIVADWKEDVDTVNNYEVRVAEADELNALLESTESALYAECKSWLEEYKGMTVDGSLTLDQLIENDPELKNLLGQRLEDLYALRLDVKSINAKVNGIDEWAYWPFLEAPNN